MTDFKIFCDSQHADWLFYKNLKSLSRNEVYVFQIDQENFTNIDQFEKYLNSEELIRYHKLFRKADKNNFLLSRIGLKILISRSENFSLNKLILYQPENKKPYLVFPESDLHFNISHAGTKVLISISYGIPSGIDIELIKKKISVDLVAGSYYSKKELSLLKESTHATQLFFTYWTRKESVVKLIGLNLLDQIHYLEVSENENLISNFPVETGLNDLWLSSFRIGEYEACIALPQNQKTIKFVELQEDDLVSWFPQ